MSSWKAGCTRVALIAVAVSLAGCRLPSGNDNSEGNVVRYAGQEVATTGAFVLTNEISVRRAADPGAETIQVLRPGTSVQQKAEFSGFTLLSWSGPDGSEQTGWIPTETAKAEANAPAQPAAAQPALKLPNKVPTVAQPQPQPTVAADKCTGGKVFDGTSCRCPASTSWNGSSCVDDDVQAQTCTGGKVFDGTSCRCPASTSWNGSSCVDAEQAKCTGGKVFDGTSCKCPASTSWNGSSCVDAAQSCTGGKVWNGSACACPASTSWDGSTCVAAAQTCTGGKVWNGSACACPSTTQWDGATCVRRKINL